MATSEAVGRFVPSRAGLLSLVSIIVVMTAWALLAHFNSQALHWIVAGSGATGAPGIMVNK
jgi:hypothetical protein